MKKTKILFLVIFICTWVFLPDLEVAAAEPEFLWEYPAGGHSNSWKLTTDSNFVYTYKEECPINYEDRDNLCNTTIMKISKVNGILSWEKKIVDFKASSICSDDSYMYWGGRTTNLTDNNYRLVKADKGGNVLWTRYWNTTPSIFGESLALHDDHLYLCGASINETHPENHEISLICYNSSGVHQWNASYIPVRPTVITSICTDGNIIYACGALAAENEYGVNSSNSFLLLKWDVNGTLLWDKEWDRADYNLIEEGVDAWHASLRECAIMADDIVVCGGIYSGHGCCSVVRDDCYIAKLNAQGEFLWEILYEDQEWFYSVWADESRIVAGGGNGIMKFASNGTKTHQGGWGNRFYDVVEESDITYACVYKSGVGTVVAALRNIPIYVEPEIRKIPGFTTRLILFSLIAIIVYLVKRNRWKFEITRI